MISFLSLPAGVNIRVDIVSGEKLSSVRSKLLFPLKSTAINLVYLSFFVITVAEREKTIYRFKTRLHMFGPTAFEMQRAKPKP